MVGNPPSRRHREHGFDFWVRKIPWRRKWQPTPVSCLENPLDRGAWLATVHGVSKESDTTEHTHTTAIFRIKSKCLSKCYIEFPHPLMITFPSDFIFSPMPSQLAMFPKDSLCSLALTFPPQKSFFPGT